MRTQGPLTLARSEPEPDVAIVSSTMHREADPHPHTAALVVEVARIEVFREPDGTEYRSRAIVEEDGRLEPVALGGVTVAVADLMMLPA